MVGVTWKPESSVTDMEILAGVVVYALTLRADSLECPSLALITFAMGEGKMGKSQTANPRDKSHGGTKQPG